jgi:hypothetical protein
MVRLDDYENYFFRAAVAHDDFGDALCQLLVSMVTMMDAVRIIIRNENFFDMIYCVWKYVSAVCLKMIRRPDDMQARLQAFIHRLQRRHDIAEDNAARARRLPTADDIA